MNATLTEIAARIKAAKSAVILTHMRPDGDAFGSALGLSAALDRLGIPNTVCDESDIPSNLAFLEGTEKIQKQLPEAELYIAVDSSDEQRLGALAEPFRAAAKKHDTVNIDHHVSNARFCKYNFVRPRSSNCENMAELVQLLGVKPDKLLAGYLMMGMVTDSGAFSHSDVNGDTFRAAAYAADAGADVSVVTYEIFKKQTKNRSRLYADVISALRYELNDALAIAVVSRRALEKYGLKQDATEGIVDFALTVDAVEVSVCLMEVRRGQYKASFRSKGTVNVNEVAGVFGGGGHILASGCMLFGDYEEVFDKLRFAVAQRLPQ